MYETCVVFLFVCMRENDNRERIRIMEIVPLNVSPLSSINWRQIAKIVGNNEKRKILNN